MAPSSSLLVECFERVCKEQRSRVAIYALSENRAISFDEVWRDLAHFRQALRAAHLPARSFIVSLVGNRAGFVPALAATLDHGAALIPLDPGSVLGEVWKLVEQFGASAVIAPATTEVPAVESLIALPSGLALFRIGSSSHGAGIASAAVIKLTSGSEGRPKAVVYSEANLAADGRHIIEAMAIGPEDVNLAAIPLSHSYGLGNLVMPLILQGSALVLRESFAPTRLFDDVGQCGVTVVPGVPFLFDYMRKNLVAQKVPNSLRLLITAGATIHYETVEEVRRMFGLKIHSFYGTSETGGIAYDDSETVENPLPVGHCLPGTTVTLLPMDGAADGEGRVHVCGDAVASGYVECVEPTEHAAFRDGGFLTGDIGYFNSRRQLVLTGRVSRFVNVAGRKIHPDEVERVLLQMPQIVTARVIGLPCEKRGEMLVACIVPAPHLRVSTVAIRKHCSSHLPPYKIPREYLFVDALPIDSRGKTDHRALEALATRQIGGARR